MATLTQAQLNKILRLHTLWLEGDSKGERADLRQAELYAVDLQYSVLSEAKLRHANLRSADLSGADLRYADLRFCDLRSADLSGADLWYADLRYANLLNTDLRYADLRHADFDFATFPLWCGSFGMKVDEDFIYQLAYHMCKLKGKKKGRRGHS